MKRLAKAAFPAAALALTVIAGMSSPARAQIPFIGQLQFFPYTFEPRGWSFCNGQLLPISSNTALFALLGTTFGGDGRVTFALPDMRGRSPIHDGGSAGSNLTRRVLGSRGGVEKVTLSASEVPSHTHTDGDCQHRQSGGADRQRLRE